MYTCLDSIRLGDSKLLGYYVLFDLLKLYVIILTLEVFVRRRALNFDIDLDWKPEPENEDVEPQDDHQAQSQTRPSASGFISRTPYRGALTIIEYDFEPRMIEVIRDTDKLKMRFPFGGIQSTDDGSSDGSKRETMEEVGLSLGKLTRDNFVGELSGGPNCTIFIFAKTLPAERRHKVILGTEQRDHVAMLMTSVDRCVDQNLFSRNHANAWRLFRRWRVGKSY